MSGEGTRPACFGKLPFWREYLEVGIGHPTARALKEWMLRGKQESAMDQAEEGYRDVPVESRLRILFGVDGSRELLAGVLRPSRDAGGRHYPFVLFTHFPRRLYGRHFSLLPLALTPVWRALDDAWDALAESTDREGFQEALDSLELPALAAAKVARGDFQGREGESADELFAAPAASRAELTRSLPGLLERLPRSGADGLSVQLPVNREVDEACFDASFWIELINRQFRLRRFEPSVFLDEHPESRERAVVLRFGLPRPADYVSIVSRPRVEAFLRPAHAAPEGGSDPPSHEKSDTYAELLACRFRSGRTPADA
jgi:type VI secretion system ImpM family protein